MFYIANANRPVDPIDVPRQVCLVDMSLQIRGAILRRLCFLRFNRVVFAR